MKKILLGAALVAAGAAMAADSTQFGVLKVPSSAAETIVSVPWLESSTDAQSVSVSNLVLTAGLTVNDELMLYTGSGYACWILKEKDNVKYWEPGTTVTTSDSITAATADQAKIARGSAIILKRGGTIADCFYIMGKPTTDTATPTTLALSSDGKKPAYSLIAPPFVADTNVNTGLTWSGISGENDSLVLSDGTSLGWKASQNKWCVWDGKAWDYNKTISAGTGCWFVTTSNTGTKTVSWEAPKQ